MINFEKSFNNFEQKEKNPKMTVWIIEDDEDLLELISEEIGEKEKYLNLKLFSFAKEAFNQIESGEIPDIIILDKNLDKDKDEFRDGTKVLKKIKERCLDDPPVICTFTNQKEAEKEMLNNGADYVFPKDILKLVELLSNKGKLEKVIKESKNKR